jgi:XTP/dITP diphosphohydrolase
VIRLTSGDRLVVASHNLGKVREIRDLLEPFELRILSAAELQLAEPEETGASFAANAALKAEAAAAAAGLAALADDSGLCVDGLAGAPGIHSARWAGPQKDFRIAFARIEEGLGGNPDHRAHFTCALALAAPGEETQIFEGRVFGTLTFPPRGDKGFGYDSIFVPEGHRFTFGEMNPEAKHAISHRARAFEKFVHAVIAPGTEG